jgi:hypothetical protein
LCNAWIAQLSECLGIIGTILCRGSAALGSNVFLARDGRKCREYSQRANTITPGYCVRPHVHEYRGGAWTVALLIVSDKR